jgi:pimeloyl-ACP methyl ester carboxylesterase
MLDLTARSTVIFRYQWQWQGQTLSIAYQTAGTGSPLLLLPAFSTVSSRTEMGALAAQLSGQFQVITVDFPGFGDSSRPPLDYNPALYRQFLTDFVRDLATEPITLIAAGHAAGYALNLAAQHPQLVAKLALIAPTWRGPLPTMLKGQKPWLKQIRDLIRLPVIGQFLYELNTTRGFLAFMYRRHVYADPNTLTPDLLTQKQQISQQPGARFGAGAFVTGGLDPYLDRQSAIDHLQSLHIPTFIAIGQSSPPKSKAEMEALAAVPHVVSHHLPGTLGMHEEYPQELYPVLLPFLVK